ncbi:type I-E CRISPR-associated protein Cas6/Cse3/CasE [Streptomyces sp. CA2R106]|uniref:type I-E CRISPR-associated protein Cas6/Cse3/CasE n=1 Tax=Streptomyces sp. CA2R106 TaxID=3120153 RepID=UPI00300BCA60
MYRVTYRFPRPVPQHSETWRLITAPLPPEIAQTENGARVLWRRDDASTVTVQYPRRPEPAWLLTGTVDFPQVVDMGVMADGLAAGQVWGFEVLANTVRRPSRKARAEEGLPVEYRVSAREWLTEESVEAGTEGAPLVSRAYSSGFSLLHLADEQSVARKGPPSLAGLTRIRGVLKVEHPESVRAALEEGLGRGRSKGAGMLDLRYVVRRPAAVTSPPARRR